MSRTERPRELLRQIPTRMLARANPFNGQASRVQTELIFPNSNPLANQADSEPLCQLKLFNQLQLANQQRRSNPSDPKLSQSRPENTARTDGTSVGNNLSLFRVRNEKFLQDVSFWPPPASHALPIERPNRRDQDWFRFRRCHRWQLQSSLPEVAQRSDRRARRDVRQFLLAAQLHGNSSVDSLVENVKTTAHGRVV